MLYLIFCQTLSLEIVEMPPCFISSEKDLRNESKLKNISSCIVLKHDCVISFSILSSDQLKKYLRMRWFNMKTTVWCVKTTSYRG